MLTLITGAPGSGKTLYVVSKLLSKVVGTTVVGENDDGSFETHNRTVYSNVRNLMLEHELVDEPWLSKWFENIKPGAFIVYDEIQKPWPNRPIGSKVPDYIQELETHRHRGCDMVLMTQNPQLVDPNLRKLVGRHLHIRRLGNTSMAIVYEWDTCSNSLNFKNAFTKTPWRYDKSAYKLYKSADLHTKVPRRLPFVMFVAVAAVAGAAYMWPTLIGRLTAPLQGKAAIAKPVPGQAGKPDQVAPQVGDLFAPGGDLGLAKPAQGPLEAVAAALPLSLPIAAPVEAVAGCIQAKTACSCYTTEGVKVDKPSEYCHAATAPGAVQLELVQPRRDLDKGVDITAPAGSGAEDLDLVQWANRGRQQPGIRSW